MSHAAFDVFMMSFTSIMLILIVALVAMIFFSIAYNINIHNMRPPQQSNIVVSDGDKTIVINGNNVVITGRSQSQRQPQAAAPVAITAQAQPDPEIWKPQRQLSSPQKPVPLTITARAKPVAIAVNSAVAQRLVRIGKG